MSSTPEPFVPTCPHCQSTFRQVKNGHDAQGRPQLRCQTCKKTYPKEPTPRGYPQTIRQTALKMYLDGTNFRRIARFLGVNHQSVINWVNAHHQHLNKTQQNFPHQNTAPAAEITLDQDTQSGTAATAVLEADELFTYIGHKKTESTS